MERFDVVVVGAGPAGASAAHAAALGGARTLLVDRRPELGQPVQCGEFLPSPAELIDVFGTPELIERAITIPPETILRETHWMVCVSPYGHRFRFPLSGYTVSRRAFDKALAHRAEGAGAELRHPLSVVAVRDDELRFADGSTARASVIVGADGPISTVARAVGFAPPREMYRMITATVDESFGDEIDLFFGRVAPGGYAWAFPRADDLNVGLGIIGPTPGRSLDQLLDRFVEKAGFAPAHERTRWWVPIGDPPRQWSSGRTLFAGDAANVVMATNGGGIPTAMLSGWLAGATAARHVREGTALSEYDRAARSALSVPLERAYQIKRSTDRVVHSNFALALCMRYIGGAGLDSVMRLRWPRRLRGGS
ncbi:MAG: geranylgeranyl reductase family protein [Thermoplasmata archaeon]